MRNWERVCPCCNQPVSNADIDFDDKLICLDCRREEKENWAKKEHSIKWQKEDKGE